MFPARKQDANNAWLAFFFAQWTELSEEEVRYDLYHFPVWEFQWRRDERRLCSPFRFLEKLAGMSERLVEWPICNVHNI